MNSVQLIGRLTRDPESNDRSGVLVANFTVAIDRPPKQDGTHETDFPRVVCFGKTAELAQRYLRKGSRVGVSGRIQTGSYQNQDGATVYTTDVTCSRLTIIDWPEDKSSNGDPWTERRQGDPRGTGAPTQYGVDPFYL